MSQRLILPIDDMLITAGYKNANYQKQFGFVHYGMDGISAGGTRAVHACGDGEVVDCGQDGPMLTGASARLGNVIVVVYRQVICNNGQTKDLTCRMYHLDKIFVKKGDKVTTDTVLGIYGNTGAYSKGAHLHVEFDTDVRFPTLTMGISAGGLIINKTADVKKYGRVDSTLSADKIWFVGEKQSLAGSQYSGVKSYLPEEADAPKLPLKAQEEKTPNC